MANLRPKLAGSAGLGREELAVPPSRLSNGCSTAIAFTRSQPPTGIGGRYYFARFFAFFEADFLTPRLGCGGCASIRRTEDSRRTLGWGRSLVLGEGLGMTNDILASSPEMEKHEQLLGRVNPLVVHQALAQRLALDQGFGLCMARSTTATPPPLRLTTRFVVALLAPMAGAGRMQSSAMPAWRLIT